MGGRGTLATQRWRGGLTFAGLIVAMIAAYAAIAGISVSVLGDSPLQAVRAAAISGTAGGVPLFPLASPSAVLPFSALEIAAATPAPPVATGAPGRPPGGGLEGSNGGTTPPPTGPGGGTRPPGQPEHGHEHAQHHGSREHHERRAPRRGEHGKDGRSHAHRPRPHRPPHHHRRSRHTHD
jgi:hypothetical protein